jgi:hypothetical protein
MPPRPGYVSFIKGDMCSVAMVSDFEAVVGRHILLTKTLMGNETTPSLFSQCDFKIIEV